MIPERFAPVLRELQPLSDRFAAAGHRLFLVGGTVRDLIVGDLRDDFDLDATTTARPDEIKRCLHGWADAIWTQGERFGTIGALKRSPGATPGEVVERVYEITTHRAEAYHDRSRKPRVEFSDDIVADLSRRDFTVNAMALELTGHAAGAEPELVDPFGGRSDLGARVLRTPLAPAESFSDDPLRMLRAARFVARYALVPRPELIAAVESMGERLEIVSAERIRDELDKLIATPTPSPGLRFGVDTGLVAHFLPELAALAGERDPAQRHADRCSHTLAMIDDLVPGGDADRGGPRSDVRLTRLAALFHELGPERTRRRMEALRFSNADTAAVSALVAMHDPVVGDEPWTDGRVRRLVHRAGRWRGELDALARAEARALVEPRATAVLAHLDALEQHVTRLERSERLDRLEPQLGGAEVMEVLGIGPGRDVGRALDFLLEVRLDEGLLPPDALERRLREWRSHHS